MTKSLKLQNDVDSFSTEQTLADEAIKEQTINFNFLYTSRIYQNDIISDKTSDLSLKLATYIFPHLSQSGKSVKYTGNYTNTITYLIL